MSDLKIRASWGINGNDMIDNTATYDKFAMSLQNSSYNITGDGSILAPGVYKTHSANNDLRWEQTEQWNIGIDAAFLNNHLAVGLDYFSKILLICWLNVLILVLSVKEDITGIMEFQ